jgi:MFS transporter, DHA1 family, multidrug resistance protein
MNLAFEITFKDPAVFFINLYTAYVYGIYYRYVSPSTPPTSPDGLLTFPTSFFEAFPLAYINVYHFNIGETSLTFVALAVGCILAVIVFTCFLKFYALPLAAKQGPGKLEDNLIPALLMSMLLPAGMFWWGWTSGNPDIHWIVGLIGVVMFTFGAFILMQCIFVYLPMTYPMYAASLFAANDFFRSAMAGGSIILAHPLYQNLGIGRGISVMAGLGVGGVIGVWCLWWFGERLRARSKFAVKSSTPVAPVE